MYRNAERFPSEKPPVYFSHSSVLFIYLVAFLLLFRWTYSMSYMKVCLVLQTWKLTLWLEGNQEWNLLPAVSWKLWTCHFYFTW